MTGSGASRISPYPCGGCSFPLLASWSGDLPSWPGRLNFSPPCNSFIDLISGMSHVHWAAVKTTARVPAEFPPKLSAGAHSLSYSVAPVWHGYHLSALPELLVPNGSIGNCERRQIRDV